MNVLGLKPSTVKDIAKCHKEIIAKIEKLDIQMEALKIIAWMVIDLEQSKAQMNLFSHP